MSTTQLTFKSAVSVYLTYLFFKAAPLVAVVYYFTNWYWAILAAIILLIVILIYSGHTNHHFEVNNHKLLVHPILSFWKKQTEFPFDSITTVQIKYAVEKDNRQWLVITTNKTTTPLKYRCDWLHLPDLEDDDEHDHEHGPESHELFELLEDEDFYSGSLQHLADSLKKVGIVVQEVGYV